MGYHAEGEDGGKAETILIWFFLIVIVAFIGFMGHSIYNDFHKNETPNKPVCGTITHENGSVENLTEYPVQISIDIATSSYVGNLSNMTKNSTLAAASKVEDNYQKIIDELGKYGSKRWVVDSYVDDAIKNSINQNETYRLVTEDSSYKLYNLNDTLEVMRGINFSFYRADIYDCDDFSWEAMVEVRKQMRGSAFGYLHVANNESHHAVNIFVDDNLSVWYIDPQDLGVYSLNEMPYNEVVEVII